MTTLQRRLVLGMLILGFAACVLIGFGMLTAAYEYNPWAVTVAFGVCLVFGYLVTRIARVSRQRE